MCLKRLKRLYTLIYIEHRFAHLKYLLERFLKLKTWFYTRISTKQYESRRPVLTIKIRV